MTPISQNLPSGKRVQNSSLFLINEPQDDNIINSVKKFAPPL